MVAAGARDVRRCAVAAAVLATLVATGCTATEGPTEDPTRDLTGPSGTPAPSGAAPTTTPTPTPTTTPTPTPTPSPSPSRPIRIAVAGDLHFEGVLADRLRDPATALAPASSPLLAALAAADVAIINLETSVGTGGRPEPGKRFTFSAGPEAFTALAGTGIDVVSMANNHALDFGRARLPSTLRAARVAAGADPPLSVIGVGRDRGEAFRPALSDIDGTVVATLAATVADLDPTADRTGQWAATSTVGGTADAVDPASLLAAVRRADRTADVVVAYLHWGVQGERCPSADQKTLADSLVDAGADVVVGSHAHQLQGDGRLGRGYVAYGLGNFAWYSPGTDATSRTGVLTLTVRPPQERPGRARVMRADWRFGVIGTDGLPAEVLGEQVAAFRAERQDLRDCAGLPG